MLHEILQNKLQNYTDKNLTIVQIGGNDGILDDPIYSEVCKFNYNLHVVEPVPKYYDELKQNYLHMSNVKCYNFAISSFTGVAKLNYINCVNSKYDWLKGCSSLYTNKNVLSGFMGKSLDIKASDDIIKFINLNKSEIIVNTFTLSDFLKNNSINSVDVFITDTEGEDFNIFKQFDFKNYKPKLYYTEIYNWTDEEKGKSISKLTNLNYICITDGYNMLAYEQ